MDTNDVAAQIVANVAARGYLPEERPAWQIVARQAMKLTEEVYEYAEAMQFQLGQWVTDLRSASIMAEEAFDDDDGWRWIDPPSKADLAQAWKELADILVVVRVAEYAINKERGLSLSLDEAALLKSSGDVERGVRNGTK